MLFSCPMKLTFHAGISRVLVEVAMCIHVHLPSELKRYVMKEKSSKLPSWWRCSMKTNEIWQERGIPSTSWFPVLYILTHKPLIHFRTQRSPQKNLRLNIPFCPAEGSQQFFFSFLPKCSHSKVFPMSDNPHHQCLYRSEQNSIKRSFKNFLFGIMLDWQRSYKVDIKSACQPTSSVGDILHTHIHLSKLRN